MPAAICTTWPLAPGSATGAGVGLGIVVPTFAACPSSP